MRLYSAKLVLLAVLRQLAEMIDTANHTAASPAKDHRPQAAVTPALSFEVLSRDQGKRERTRSILLDATAKLIASRDPGDISICDITNAAGMANGTFYYHFASKAEIVAETALGIAGHLSNRIHKAGAEVTDPVEQIAVGSRHFVYFCVDYPTWAWALGRSVNSVPSIRKQIYRKMSETVRRGIKEGVFQVDDIELTYEILVSMAFAAARAGLEGMDAERAGSVMAEMQLRALGVPPERARLASRTKIEPLSVRLSELDASLCEDEAEG